MKVILITPPDYFIGESSLINRMFENGLPILHLRKPGCGAENLSEYLINIKQEFHPRIVTHSCYDLLEFFNLGGIHIKGIDSGEKNDIINRFKKQSNLSISISYHDLEDLDPADVGIDYIFLSPVFDSISKKNYKSRFSLKDLKDMLKRIDKNVIALGGCRAENLNEVKELGFSGAAFLGAVWDSADPLESFMTIKKTAEAI